MNKILQRLNNNVLLVTKDGVRKIVMGKGIGFQAKVGDYIADYQIESTYIMQNQKDEHMFQSLIEQINQDVIDLTSQLIEIAKRNLDYPVQDTVIITLSDHIDSAIQRFKEGVQFVHPLTFEFKRVYKQEYELALSALNYIEHVVGIRLPDEEAAFIALHYVSARSDQDEQMIQEELNLAKVIHEVLKIISFHFQTSINEDSLDFSRFLIHLKFFLKRQNEGIAIETIEDEIMEITLKQNKKVVEAVDKVIIYLQQTYGWSIPSSERFFLTLHVKRLISHL